MLLYTFTKTVMRRKNQNSSTTSKEHIVGMFACDHCQTQFEVEYCLQQRLTKRHQFCSRKCQGASRKPGGCQYYIYSTFESALKDPETHRKSKQTMLERYGAEYYMQCPQLKRQQEQTMIERYGVPFSVQSAVIRAKYDWFAIAQKRHETMKREGTYGKSKPEDKLHTVLCEIFGSDSVERQSWVHKWPIDFYVKNIDTYVQYDSYWHGVGRTIEEVAEYKTRRDVVIHRKMLTDIAQGEHFVQYNMKLVRIRGLSLKQITTKTIKSCFGDVDFGL